MAKRWRGRASAVAGVVAIAGVLFLFPSAAAASGGGGCGGPVSDAAGTRVDIRGNCFSPTILRAAPGDVITFTNTDPNTHTVLGANGAWGGYDLLKRGREATYAFTEAGVYPYVCTLHAGMVGTIVVGDGVGGAIDTTTAAGPVVPGGSASTLGTVPAESSIRLELDAGAWPMVVLGLLAAILTVLAALVVVLGVRRGVGSLEA
jgi:plastocyanin